MDCKHVFDILSFAVNVFIKKVYLAITAVTKNTIVNSCICQFRNFAEFFYFVMFPLRQGQGFLYSILTISANRP